MPGLNNRKAFMMLLCGMLICNACVAQDSLYIGYLVNRIALLQSKEDGAFLKGSFPSYISKHESFSSTKKDNNIFYNGLIDYTLKNTRQWLNETDQLRTDSLLALAKPVFEKFKNRKGRQTYNFWRTDTAFYYPYIGLVNLIMKKADLPDDMDDTVLSLLALDADDSTAKEVHALMQQYINSDTVSLRTVIESYENYPAYSTWFGKKFPVVFDVSVLCNILSFVQHYKLVWTKADSASLDLIIETIQKDYHRDRPVYASPYYPKTSLILYHIARLMSIQTIPALEAVKTKLLTDALVEFAQSVNLPEKIILSSAILKWGYEPPAIQLPSLAKWEKQIEQNDFSFFAGNIPSYFSDWLRKYASDKQWLIYYHYCPAFNDALVLEYLLLKNN